MAVFKGREVAVVGKTNGEDTAPLYTIQEQSGQRADVPMNQIQFTKDEVKDLEKNAAWHLDSAKVIEDKDLQSLRDSQDPKKIEEQNKKHPSDDKPVKAPTYVKPSEVKSA